MIIYLYRNNAESNRVDKSKFLEPIAELQGTLRNQTSIINPNITIELTDNIVNGLLKEEVRVFDDDNKLVVEKQLDSAVTVNFRRRVLTTNYVFIPEFSRYYFVDDIISLGNNFWSISLSVDVLMSFKKYIYNLNCWVDRNEYEFDTALPDNSLPIKNGNTVIKIDCVPEKDIIYKIKDYTDLNSNTDVCIILQLVGNLEYSSTGDIHNSTPFNTMYALTLNQLDKILALMCSYNWAQKLSNLFSEPTNSLIGIKIFPFIVTNEDGGAGLSWYPTKHIVIADSQREIYKQDSEDNLRLITGSQPIWIPLGTISYEIPDDFKFIYYQPYANCQLFLPYYGFTDIDINLFIKNNKISIIIDYWVDVPSGICTCVLYNEDKVKCHIVEFNIAVELPIGRSNATEVTRNMLLSSLKLATSFAVMGSNLASANSEISNISNIPAKTPKQIATKNIILQRAINQRNTEAFNTGVNTFGNFAIDAINGSQSKLSGGNVSASLNAGYIDSDRLHKTTYVPYLLFKLPNIAIDTANLPEYSHMVGRPCHKFKLLKDTNGFTVIGSCHLEHFDIATEDEIEEIERMLKSGVLFEPKQ